MASSLGRISQKRMRQVPSPAAGGLDVVAFADRERLGPHDPSPPRPAGEGDDEGDREVPFVREVAGQHDHEGQRRDDEEDVREKRQELVAHPAEVSAGEAHQDRDGGGDRGRQEGDDEGGATAVDELSEHVLALLGRAQPVGRRRPLQHGERHRRRVGAHKVRADHRHEHEKADDDQTRDHLPGPEGGKAPAPAAATRGKGEAAHGLSQEALLAAGDHGHLSCPASCGDRGARRRRPQGCWRTARPG